MNKICCYLLIFFALGVTACKKDFLERNPLDQLSDESFWETEDDARQFINATYRYITLSDEYIMYDSYSDNAVPVHIFADQGLISYGTAGPTLGRFRATWQNTYAGIRRCNIFFQNIGNVTMDEERRKKFIAEVRFLRAFYYQFLLKLYGGVPLITEPLNLTDPYPARNSAEEITAFIVDELTQAAADLDVVYTATEDIGRATKGAALALKANVQLYAGNYAEALAAAREVIALNQYSLYDKGYAGLFTDENNQEVIFDIQYLKDQYLNNNDQYFAPPSYGGWSAISPTQNFVDEFECTDGKPITSSPLYNPSDPFANRDSRLEGSMMHNGSVFAGKTINTYEGIDAYQNTGNSTRTGYYIRKYLDPENPGAQLGNSWTNFILLRYAEVLLIVAEAKNELSGPDDEVYAMVNQVRGRPTVNLPSLAAGLKQDQMRTAIRHERRVEFAFEGTRLFDIRRWRTGIEAMNKQVYGQPMPDGNGPHILVETRKFTEREYLWAIPQNDIDLSQGQLTQNPGY